MTFLGNLAKSKSDVMVGGVCGGLGANTIIPAWVWRAGFLATLFFFGSGGLVYLILWIALPDETPTSKTPTGKSSFEPGTIVGG